MANIQKTLAVRYRPKTFEEVCGQSNVVRILRNQIKTNTNKQAYLFSGKSGCGKTTVARIFARELNGTDGDITEIDAASNNSVENVRQIFSESRLLPLVGKYRIYIIDEAHMISASGWAAFLKGIEEPPASVIYIFCTTDPQKIPPTILNRVQRYGFTSLGMDVVVARLIQILDAEGIATYDRHSLEYIATLSNGGMRESISTMEKCLQYDSVLNMDNVSAALGLVGYREMFSLLRHIEAGDISATDSFITDIYGRGIDIRTFLSHFLRFIIGVIRYTATGSASLAGFSEGYDTELSALGKGTDFYANIMDGVAKLSATVRYEASPLTFVEAFFIHLCLSDRKD